jgi:hypothetical protein
VASLPLPLRHQQLIILLSLVVAVLAVFLHRALPERVAAQEDCAPGHYQSLAARLTQLRSAEAGPLDRSPIPKGVMETPQYLVQ